MHIFFLFLLAMAPIFVCRECEDTFHEERYINHQRTKHLMNAEDIKKQKPNVICNDCNRRYSSKVSYLGKRPNNIVISMSSACNCFLLLCVRGHEEASTFLHGFLKIDYI